MRSSVINIRAALNSDGPRIGQLTYEGGFLAGGLDWHNIEPDWIVAEYQGELVGALQVLPGKPVGRLELLVLKVGLPRRIKLIAAKHLTLAGSMLIRNYGGQLAMGLVRPQNIAWRKIIEKRGAVNLGSVDMYGWKVNLNVN